MDVKVFEEVYDPSQRIIDFERKGNVVRFYLGNYHPGLGWSVMEENSEETTFSKTYYGDDWDDAPYQHNADEVYQKFVFGSITVAFDIDDLVLEPSSDRGMNWTKEDMQRQEVPCILVVPKEINDNYDDDWSVWIGNKKAIRIYFNESVDELTKDLYSYELDEDEEVIDVPKELPTPKKGTDKKSKKLLVENKEN